MLEPSSEAFWFYEESPWYIYSINSRGFIYYIIMKNILFISWSPRKGNTEYVLKKVFDKIPGKKEFVALKDMNIRECIGCFHCKKTGVCVFKDDMKELTKKLLAADTIVLWSPNYFANVSWLTKIFIDRTFVLYHKSLLKSKKIALVVTGHSKDAMNKKYMMQWCFGFVKYQQMKLIDVYPLCADDEAAFKKDPKIEKKIMKILDSII